VRGGADRRVLIRSLLDIRLSRFSLAVLATVSVLATVVIITNGSGHTTAQLTALAALREPVAQAQTVAPAAPATAHTTSSAPASHGSSSPGSGSGASPPPSSSGSGSGSGSGSDGGSANSDTNTGGGSDDNSTGTTPATTTTPAATSTLPKVSHVFEIALSTTTYKAAFADKSAAPYLHSLEAKGTLLRGYESLGHGELADYLATVSGQAPNAATSAGCTKYQEFRQGVVAKSNGLVPGIGCVYPETALTIGDQVTAKGATWKAYIADMGKQTCSHPNSGAVDDALLPGAESTYDTRHNPFIYFHSLLDLGDCASDDQDLTHLSAALAHKSRTARFSFIAPGACEDAAATATTAPSTTTTTTTSTTSSTPTSSTPTSSTTPAETTTPTVTETTTTTTTSTTGTTSTETDATPAPVVGCPAGQPVGIPAEDAFLKLWVPRILASPAYKDDGVLILAFAGERGRHPGGVSRTGALVISARTKKGKVVSTAYRPYSLLRTVEDMLGDTALAHAQSAPSFAKTILHSNV
jgi:phosphatidylinositol-3-phosphatase